MMNNVSMLVAVPNTLSEQDIEQAIRDHLAEFSFDLARRMKVSLELDDAEFDSEDGIPLQECTLTLSELLPDEVLTVRSLLTELLSDPEYYICGDVIDDDYDMEPDDYLDDECDHEEEIYEDPRDDPFFSN